MSGSSARRFRPEIPNSCVIPRLDKAPELLVRADARFGAGFAPQGELPGDSALRMSEEDTTAVAAAEQPKRAPKLNERILASLSRRSVAAHPWHDLEIAANHDFTEEFWSARWRAHGSSRMWEAEHKLMAMHM